MTSQKVQRHRALLATISTEEHGLIWAKVYRDSTVARAADGAKKATQKGARLALAGRTFVLTVADDTDGVLRRERLEKSAGTFWVIDETQLNIPL